MEKDDSLVLRPGASVSGSSTQYGSVQKLVKPLNYWGREISCTSPVPDWGVAEGRGKVCPALTEGGNGLGCSPCAVGSPQHFQFGK